MNQYSSAIGWTVRAAMKLSTELGAGGATTSATRIAYAARGGRAGRSWRDLPAAFAGDWQLQVGVE